VSGRNLPITHLVLGRNGTFLGETRNFPSDSESESWRERTSAAGNKAAAALLLVV